MDAQDYYNDINKQIKELKEANKILEESNKKHEQDKIIANTEIKELKEKCKYLEEEIIIMKKNFDFLKQKMEEFGINFNKSNKNVDNNNKVHKINKGQKKSKNTKIEKEKEKNIEKQKEEENKIIDDSYPKIELKLKERGYLFKNL